MVASANTVFHTRQNFEIPVRMGQIQGVGEGFTFNFYDLSTPLIENASHISVLNLQRVVWIISTERTRFIDFFY